MKYMKKIYGLMLAALTLVGTSCSDFLEVEPQNIITLEQFWNEEQDVTNSIAGCYSAMQSYDMISRMMVWGEFRSENIQNRGNIEKDVNLERVLKENITANNSYTAWNAFYNIINRCNIIMYYAPQVQAKDPSYTQGELKAHIAECTAIRSLCYFYLIRTFENVPYDNEPYLDDAREMAIPATDFKTILNDLIASLEAVKNDAVVYYPKSNGLAGYYQTGRITQLAIYSMLCEMYLWKQDYAKSIEYADFIIDFKKKYAEEQNTLHVDYSNFNYFPLTSAAYEGSSGQIFGAAFNDLFVDNNSLESIFELSFVKGNSNMLSNGPVSNFYGASGLTGYVKPSEFLESELKSATITENSLYRSLKDGRRYENFRFNAGGEAQSINKYTVSDMLTLPSSPASNYAYTSYWGTQYPVEGTNKDSRNKSNWIIYRLTDIMLLKAEALVQQMEDDQTTLSEADTKRLNDAFYLVNAVNKRSIYEAALKDTLKLADYKTKEAINNLVYDERERELMFEGKRWYDLVRRSLRDGDTKYLRTKAKRKSTESASIIESLLSNSKAIFWPYNLEEMKVNDRLVQNPAFGSGESSSFEKN